MRLVRLATINIRKVSERLRSWKAQMGNATIKTLGYYTPGNGTPFLLTAAEMPLTSLPQVTNDDQVVVPDTECRRLEEAIEILANALAIAQQMRRTIASPHPAIALSAETDDEECWLKARRCFAPTGAETSRSTMIGKCNVLEMLPQLADRKDGMSLMAEAFAHESAAGEFKEHIRLFERAFRTANERLVEPLADYLAQAPYDYNHDEIREWIIHLRHPLTHADSRPSFLVEADVQSFMPRIRQAAYDVLFNKCVWRSRDLGRRALWSPDAFTASGGWKVRGGSTPTIIVQFLDDLGIYPRNLRANITRPPATWWYGFPDEQPLAPEDAT